MKLAVARPGYFDERRFAPSMQTNWINYDLLLGVLEDYFDVSVVTIGFKKDCGADRWLKIHSFGDIEHDENVYRTKTQQATTTSIMDPANDRLLDGVDALLMPYYTFFDNRCYYYTLAYLACEAGIPLMLWDTDANFISQVGLTYSDLSVEDAAERVFANPVYVNEDEIDISMARSLDLRVLTPALDWPDYTHYFPFFPIFGEYRRYRGEDKEYDVVYAGSQYQREEAFLRYYNTDRYSVGVVGKYSKKFRQQWAQYEDVYQGHIPRTDVQDFLTRGASCVHIARKLYNKIGHITPRVYEVISAGTVLLVHGELSHCEEIVGKQFVVNDAEEVEAWVSKSDEVLAEFHEEQAHSPFISKASPVFSADLFWDILRG